MTTTTRNGRLEKRKYESELDASKKLLIEKDVIIADQINEIQQLQRQLELSKKEYLELNQGFQHTIDQLSQSEAMCLNCMMLPRRLGSEVVEQAKRHVQSANKINFTILKDYTHEGFLRKEIEVGGPQSELLQLLSNILEAIKAAKDVKKKNYRKRKFTSPKLNFQKQRLKFLLR